MMVNEEEPIDLSKKKRVRVLTKAICAACNEEFESLETLDKHVSENHLAEMPNLDALKQSLTHNFRQRCKFKCKFKFPTPEVFLN